MSSQGATLVWTVIASLRSRRGNLPPRHRKTERLLPRHREAYRAVAVSRQGCRGDCHGDKPPRNDKSRPSPHEKPPLLTVVARSDTFADRHREERE